MSAALWTVLPYVALASFVFGTWWRYRTDKAGWTARSSQLHERRLLSLGSPLFHSAALPLALTVLLYGVRRLRPALAGFGFGVAGALMFAAISGTVDVRFVFDVLDGFWLAANAAVAAFFAAATIRKSVA